MKNFFSYFYNVFVVAYKPKSNRNKTGFILYATGFPPLNSKQSRKKQVLDFVSRFGSQLKTLIKIYEKILFSSGFTKPALKFFRQKFKC